MTDKHLRSNSHPFLPQSVLDTFKHGGAADV